jgi:hypothetical protein
MADTVFYDTVTGYDVTQLQQSACKEFDADFGAVDVQSAGEPRNDFSPLQFRNQQHFDDHRNYHYRQQQQQPHYHYQPHGMFSSRDAVVVHDTTRQISQSAPTAFQSSYGHSYPAIRHGRSSISSDPVSNMPPWALTPHHYSIQDGYRSASPSSSSSEQLHGLCDVGDIYRTDAANFGGRGGLPDCGVGAQKNVSPLARIPFPDCNGNGIGIRRLTSAGNQTSSEADAAGMRRTTQRDGKTATTARLEIYPWMMESRQSAEKLHRQQQQKQLMAVLPGV